MKRRILENKKYILFILLFIVYFSFTVTICFDSAHYVSMTNIFEGNSEWENWDIVRGWFFPFLIYLSNSFFGKTNQALLITTFIFYILLIYYSIKFSKELFKDHKKLDIFFKYLIIFIIVFNPIVFGYFHTLLTEFVAITFSTIFCYISWKWLKINKINSKENIFYTIIFVIFTSLSWSLKQPYVSTVLFPVIIASIISIIHNFNFKNIFYRISTIMLSLIFLFFSLTVWNAFLKNKNIEINSDRSSGNVLGNQLIKAVDHFKIETNTDYYSIKSINKNKFLNNHEKETLRKNKDYKIVSIFSNKNKMIDQNIILTNDNLISSKTGINFITKQFLNHPNILLESYFSNYMALTNIYSYNPIDFKVIRHFNLGKVNENSAIAYKCFRTESNIFYMPNNLKTNVMDYEKVNDSPKILKNIFRIIEIPSNYIFNITTVLIPFIFIFSFIFSIISKKYLDEINAVVILSGYSFLHILAHAVTGAIIDRYASPAYLTSLLSIIILIYLIIKNIIRRSTHEKRKSIIRNSSI